MVHAYFPVLRMIVMNERISITDQKSELVVSFELDKETNDKSLKMALSACI